MNNSSHKIYIFLEERRKKTENRIKELEYKLSTISFDEDGNLSNNFIEDSPYFSAAQESADFFRGYVLSNELKDNIKERKKLEEQRKIYRVNLKDAKDLLKEQNDILKQKNNKLNYDEVKKVEEDIAFLRSEIKSLEKSISIIRIAITGKEDLARKLRRDKKNLEERKKKRSEYLNLDEIKKDMNTLVEIKFDLERIQDFLSSFESKTEKQDKPNKEKFSKLESIEEPINMKLPESESISIPNLEKPLAPNEINLQKDWKLDSFKLDFIEKFGYVPSNRERELNKNYNGDYSSLISHPRELNIKEVQIPKGRIVVGLNHISTSVTDSIKKMSNKNFKTRRDVEISENLDLKTK